MMIKLQINDEVRRAALTKRNKEQAIVINPLSVLAIIYEPRCRSDNSYTPRSYIKTLERLVRIENSSNHYRLTNREPKQILRRNVPEVRKQFNILPPNK